MEIVGRRGVLSPSSAYSRRLPSPRVGWYVRQRWRPLRARRPGLAWPAKEASPAAPSGAAARSAERPGASRRRAAALAASGC